MWIATHVRIYRYGGEALAQPSATSVRNPPADAQSGLGGEQVVQSSTRGGECLAVASGFDPHAVATSSRWRACQADLARFAFFAQELKHQVECETNRALVVGRGSELVEPRYIRERQVKHDRIPGQVGVLAVGTRDHQQACRVATSNRSDSCGRRRGHGPRSRLSIWFARAS